MNLLLSALFAPILFVASYAVYAYWFSCPKELKNLPRVPLLTFLTMAILRKPQTDRSKLIADSSNEDGLARICLLGRWCVTVSNPEYNRRILNNIEKYPKLDMKDIMPNALGVKLLGDHVASTNGATWKRHRKIVAPAFHNFQPYVGVFAKGAEELSAVIEKRNNVVGDKGVNVTDLFSLMTVDVISRAGFNFDLNALNAGRNRWLDAYKIFITGVFDPLLFIFPALEKLNLGNRKENLTGAASELDTLFYKVIDKRSQEIAIWKEQQHQLATKGKIDGEAVERPNDLLALMIFACEEYNKDAATGKQTLSAAELRNNLLVFFIAGHETTANALSSLFYYLAIYPEIQQKIRDECDRIMDGKPKDATATFEEQKKMVYLTGVMKESLRLNSPVTGLGMRVLKDPAGDTLGNQYIPPNMCVMPQIWSMHHDTKVWGADPTVFDPMRYVTEEVDEGVGIGTVKEKSIEQIGEQQRMSWMPFGAGPRACLGLNFSLIEQRIVISHLLRQYNVRLPKDSLHKHGIVNGANAIVAPVEMTIIFEKLA